MEKSGVSLEKKVKRIAVCAGAVVFFSIGANLAVSWFGLGSFGSILEQNAGTLAFWSAMEEERLAFARYAGTALPEERERFEQSRMETRRRLERKNRPDVSLICARKRQEQPRLSALLSETVLKRT